MTITWKINNSPSTGRGAKASIGLKWAQFSFSGELLSQGDGAFCGLSSDELAAIVAEAPVAIDALIATIPSAHAAAKTAPARRSSGSYADRAANLRRSPESFAREMDRDDCPF